MAKTTHDQNTNRGPDVGNCRFRKSRPRRGSSRLPISRRGDEARRASSSFPEIGKRREGATKGAQGTQSPDRSNRFEVPKKTVVKFRVAKACLVRRRLTEEVAHKRRLGMSYRTTDAR